MQIKVDDVLLFQLEDWEKNVILNDIPSEIFDDDMKRRLQWALKHKAEQSYKRLQDEWLPVLQDDPNVLTIPADKQGFVELVLARPEYQNRSQRDAAL